MLTSSINCIRERTDRNASGGTFTIRCYVYPLVTTWQRQLLKPDRQLAFEALAQLLRLDRDLRETRADWDQERFRRLMRIRPKVVARLRRRWQKLNPQPRIPLGIMRRRYHASLAGYLYQRKE